MGITCEMIGISIGPGRINGVLGSGEGGDNTADPGIP